MNPAPLPFERARLTHYAVRSLAEVNEPRARALWAAVTGDVGAPPAPGSVIEAIRDTVPPELETVLALDDVAAAFAFDAMLGVHEATTPFQMRERAGAAWAKVTARAKAMGDIEEGFGWDRSAAWKHTRDVAHRTMDLRAVERIARMAGRMYACLKGNAAKKVPGIPAEVYSVEQGNAVERLLPSEVGQLADETLGLAVLGRIATRRAGQYAIRGTEKKSRGPLALVLDESSSMHGHRNEWCKAAALAVARVAAEDKRPVVVVHMSTSAVTQPLDPRSPASVLEMIHTFLSGGTDIATGLARAVEEVAGLQRGGKKGADIVLVTDGVDDSAEEQATLLDLAAKLGAKLWTVAIDEEIPETSPLRARASAYTHLDDRQLRDEGVLALAGAAS